VRLLGATVLSAFGLAAFSPLSNVVAGWVSTPADLGKADAIVVLGGGSEWPRGELNSTMLHRTIHGIRLYREGLAPLLVLSGGQRRAPPSEGTGRAGPHDVGRGRAGGASARPSRCSEHPARHRCLSDRGGQVRHGRRIPRAKSRWARPGRGSPTSLGGYFVGVRWRGRSPAALRAALGRMLERLGATAVFAALNLLLAAALILGIRTRTDTSCPGICLTRG
jgi:hypothetical protein